MIILREAADTDRNFITGTWTRGARFSNEYFKAMDSDAYYALHAKLMVGLANTSKIIIACLQAEPDVIIGYAIGSELVLHWLYVKPAFRKAGIARTLASQFPNIKFITGYSRSGMEIANKYNWVLIPI